MRLVIVMLAALALAAPAATQQPPIDPLTARVDSSAADRFAALWRKTGGKPTAAQLQSDYLANGGPAIAVFTPGRINSAERLAAKIAEKPELYGDAVERCLPWVAGTNAQLRAAYLGLKGLFPAKPLPKIAVVVGRDNSGGTAGNGMQVIGLEVICRLSPTRAAFEERMRQFFAHETVHTLQRIDSPAAIANMLLTMALSEGVPDLVTMMITGGVPSPERDRWAREREAWIWSEFQSDAKIVQAGTAADGQMNAAAQAASRRWFGNAGDPPAGWPDELGYWVGMRIAEQYVAKARDPYAVLDALLVVADPKAILAASGYRPAPAR
ncbi:hypothetical protein [Sphingomonas mesophila]|uniref:gliding motility protein GldB-related protein n=1 Tax=Sphingomonas mesophila TaxID=2303576 RepID=UPI000E589FA4|nr:hypothetical protein [Sphingomonas mesophila]